MIITTKKIDVSEQSRRLNNASAGAYASFEGWVRNENEGFRVLRLEYEIFEPIATKEGKRIFDKAKDKYAIIDVNGIHRSGLLEIGECAVWIGVLAPHRKEAFDACRYVIDQIKTRLPIWKKEYYVDGNSGWVNCERCASAS
ncbi:MAG: molybdenum cofactor biosynthesis protein MoaE [Pseudomonadota bacterium]|nr:molybdenum cofactor biosynthesis protein MoaE [Pseudomonadota bacterium]